jgi:putative inorganic carbon (HCO3(-)) transporter
VIGHLQLLLLVLVVGLRPLAWDGDPAGPAHLAYLGLVLAAATVTWLAVCGGAPLRWNRWGWAVAVLLAALLPAALTAPEPVVGRAVAVQLVVLGVLAWLVLQAGEERRGAVLGALVGSLVVEGLLALGQQIWGLPAMAAANAAGGLGMLPMEAIGERIANGGVFTTFTLSNVLAGWLLLVLPLATGVVAGAGSHGVRAVGLVAVLLGGLALVLTGSKGAWLSAGVVGVLVWCVVRRTWWPVALAPVVALVVFLVPAIQEGLTASARVRWEYWQGAWELVLRSPWIGHGWGAFAQQSAQVMPVMAEPTRLVHSGPLELAVSAGLPLAVLALGLASVGVVRSLPSRDSVTTTGSAVPAGVVVGLAAGAGAYGSLLGGMEGTLAWWPGGGGLGSVPWGAALGAVFGLVVVVLRTASWPAGPWTAIALGAFLLHALADITWESQACLGTVLIVMAATARTTEVCRSSPRWLMGGAVLTAVVLVANWAPLAVRQRTAADTVALLAQAQQPGPRGEQILQQWAGTPVPPSRRGEVWRDYHAHVTLQAGDDYATRLELALLLPPGVLRDQELDRLVVQLPHRSVVAVHRSEGLARAGRFPEAVAEARRAVANAPALLPVRRHLVQCLRAAGAEFVEEAQVHEAEILRLSAIVHPKNR